MITCVGCGALVEDADGPTHAYIGASPGCWAIFSEMLIRYTGPFGQWLVDAYAVQHPGKDDRRAAQSVCVHLMNLCAAFERHADPAKGAKALQFYLSSGRDYPWLDPPADQGELTVLDVAADPTDAIVDRYARAVWNAWSAHHAAVRAMLDELG